MSETVLTLISAALVTHLLLLNPDGETPRQRLHALGLGTLVLLMVVLVPAQAAFHYALVPLALGYLQLYVLLPLCVLLVAPVLAALQAWRPGWPFSGLTPLVLGNSGLLGLCLQANQSALDAPTAFGLSLACGLGYWGALLALHDLQQRLDLSAIPESFRGAPVLLASAGIACMALMGLDGLFGL